MRKQALRQAELDQMEDRELILQDPRHLARCPTIWTRYVNAPFGGPAAAHQRSRELCTAIDISVLPKGAPEEFKGQRKILQDLVKAWLTPGPPEEQAQLMLTLVSRRVISYMIACQASVGAARSFLSAESTSGLDPTVAHFVAAESKKKKSGKHSDRGKGKGKGGGGHHQKRRGKGGDGGGRHREGGRKDRDHHGQGQSKKPHKKGKGGKKGKGPKSSGNGPSGAPQA
jgi:hypothetical protein